MKDIFISFEKMPWVIAGCLIVVHGFLLAEYTAIFTKLIASAYDEALYPIVQIVSKINYTWVWVYSIVTWIITSFMFHLAAIIMDGRSNFKNFLKLSAYPYLIPMVVICMGIMCMQPGQISLSAGSDISSLIFNGSLHTFASIIGLSYIIMYGWVIILVHHVYQISYIKSIVSVIMPVSSLWIFSKLLEWIF